MNYYNTHLTKTRDPKHITKNKLERGMVVKLRYKKEDGIKYYMVLVLQPSWENKLHALSFNNIPPQKVLSIAEGYDEVLSESIRVRKLGLTKIDINSFFETGRLNTSLIQTIGEEKLASGIQSYKAVMVGASGALYGILVGFAMLFPNVQLMLLFPPIPIKAKYLVPLLILFDLFFGFTSYSVGPIAHFAHIGGAITGFIMMWYWKRNQFNNKRWN